MKNQKTGHIANRGPKHQGKRTNTNHPQKKPIRAEAQGDNQQGNRPFKKRFIKRDKDGKQRVSGRKEGRVPKKGGKGEKKGDDRDLDRQLRDYWLTQKGKNKADQDLKEIARDKLNSEMDNYWKQKKEQAQQKPN